MIASASGLIETLTDYLGGKREIIPTLNKMATLRPFVRAVIPGKSTDAFPGGANDFVIDDAQDTRTWKFRYLRSFEYSISFGPQQVKLTLFDDAGGQVRNALSNLYNRVNGNTKPADVGACFISFEWGWAEYDDTLFAIPVRRTIKSNMHHLMVMNVEMSYEEGGIAWQIIGADTMTHMQGVITKKTYPQSTLKSAITQLFAENKSKPELPIPKFGSKEAKSGPKDTVQDYWHTNGQNLVEIMQEWLTKATSERGRPLYMFWDSVKNLLHVQDVGDTKLTASDLAGPHDVNNWDQDRGTIVIRYQPSVSGIHQLSALGQVSYHDSDIRIVGESTHSPGAEKLGGPNQTLGQGMQVHQGNREKNPVSDKLHAQINQGQYDEIFRALGVKQGSAYLACNAELECIGWPLADDVVKYLFRTIKLNVYSPYGLDGEDNDFGWKRYGPGGLDLYLSGEYIINSLTHMIDDSGYRMKVSVTRNPGPQQPALQTPK